MSSFTVKSTICSFTHKISGKKEGKKIVVDIDSPCEKINKFSHFEVSMRDILSIKDNFVIDRALEADCSSNCLVPCAVLTLCRMEFGLIAKSLVKQSGSISIEFDEV